jgi:hypothetical protein
MSQVTIVDPATQVLVTSAAGSIDITPTAATINVGQSVTGGQANTGANIGGGDAEVFASKLSSALQFRTLSGLNGITVSENGDVININGGVLQTVLLSHADRHKHGGGDEVASATPGANLIPKADGSGKLDVGWMPTGTFTDEAVAITTNDTTPGYLDDKVLAGAGLTSTVVTPSGDEDLRLDVVANADGSILVNADDIQVGILATDSQHGDRGGGSLHTLAIASGAAGFLSGTDKQAIDDLATTYAPLAHASRHENGGLDEISVADLSGLLADPQTPLAHVSTHANGGSDELSVEGLSGLLADGQTPLAHVSTHANGGSDELNVGGLSGTLADPQTPATHASSHAGAGGDAITSLGAVTFTGAIDWTSATIINGLTDSKLLLTDTAGTAFDMIQLGGTGVTKPAIKVNTTSPGPCIEARLADNSGSAYSKCYHIGLNSDPTLTHCLFGTEGFVGGSGNRIGVGIFPAYVPGTFAANNVYGVQGNTFFGGVNWAANSFVSALQFFPAPDYQYGSTSWGSSNLNLLGVDTGGLINIFSRTVTAASLVGLRVGTLAHIFGGPGAVSATYAAAIEVGSPSQTTGTIGTQTGIIIQPQLYGTLNQGMWLNGNAAGSDIVLGTAKSARVWYNGTNLVIDPDNAGSGIVLIGATGDDDMRLTNIEIDGNLNHDGTGVGFYGTVPVAQSAAYTPTNVSTDRSYDANATTVNELADVLGTLIADLQATGLIG